jgi:hypothetical protein
LVAPKGLVVKEAKMLEQCHDDHQSWYQTGDERQAQAFYHSASLSFHKSHSRSNSQQAFNRHQSKFTTRQRRVALSHTTRIVNDICKAITSATTALLPL